MLEFRQAGNHPGLTFWAVQRCCDRLRQPLSPDAGCLGPRRTIRRIFAFKLTRQRRLDRTLGQSGRQHRQRVVQVNLSRRCDSGKVPCQEQTVRAVLAEGKVHFQGARRCNTYEFGVKVSLAVTHERGWQYADDRQARHRQEPFTKAVAYRATLQRFDVRYV